MNTGGYGCVYNSNTGKFYQNQEQSYNHKYGNTYQSSHKNYHENMHQHNIAKQMNSEYNQKTMNAFKKTGTTQSYHYNDNKNISHESPIPCPTNHNENIRNSSPYRIVKHIYDLNQFLTPQRNRSSKKEILPSGYFTERNYSANNNSIG